MATQFLKVDLAPNSRDFEQAALEPGIALLDRTGANYRILRKWLGRLIAEPEWNRTEVSFYVCDDQGARPHDIRCEAATVSDRAGVKGLKDDMEAIKRRLQEAKPEAKEVKLHKALIQHFNAAVNPATPKQSEYHFFRYQDHGTWRLVWCWGYQRKDVVPATATICTNPTCRHLFLRRQEGSRDCPACASTAVGPPKRPTRWGRLVGLALLLALLAGGAGYIWRDWFNKPEVVVEAPTADALIVTPEKWIGPAGSQLDYKVFRKTADGEEDVTSQVVPVSENPKIVRIEKGGARISAQSAGKTAVFFYLGEQQAQSSVEVKALTNPKAIKLDPPEATLGIGSTARLRVQGDMGDGQWIDLSENAEWEPVAGAKVSCLAGQLEGLAEGESTIKVRFRATANDEYRTAEARIKVIQETYTKLEIEVEPGSFKEGTEAALSVALFNKAGTKYSGLNSSQLSLTLETPGIAAIEDETLTGLRAGQGKLKGQFAELQAKADFTVTPDLTGRFVVRPKKLELMVGEITALQVSSASSESIRVVSSAPAIVEVQSGLKVVGRSPGKAELRVMQEAREAKIEVEVSVPDLKSIAFMPARVSVPVDRSVPVRLVAHTKDDKQFDLAADTVSWDETPEPGVAELDMKKLELLGRVPTEDSPQLMVANLNGLRALGEVDVVPGPLQIELTPAGSTELPEGQVTQLHAWARYGGGTRTEVDASRIEWRLDPPTDSGLQFDPLTATVRAAAGSGKSGDAKLRLKAVYQGFTSNEVEIESVAQELTLALHTERPLILVGDEGDLRATVQGAPIEFALVGTSFESSNPESLTIDKESGFFQALTAGKATVTATHPRAKSPAVIDLEVISNNDVKLELRPGKFQLLVNARQPLELVLMAGSTEEKISLVSELNAPRIGISQPASVLWQAPSLVGVKPTQPFEISVEHAGKTARAVVEVIEGTGNIRVVPESTRLSAGQAISPRLEQQLPGGDLWQEINPALVTWKVPENVQWTPARKELRPQLTPSESASGTLTLEAAYAGKSATLQINVDGELPPSGPLAVVREPEGEDLAVDTEQRFTIVVGPEGKRQPAVDVQWQPAFENDFVRWNPPVLFAKLPGHEQVLGASVGDEKISFITRTVVPAAVDEAPSAPTEKPAEVRLLADQSQPIMLPVGAHFSSFRVAADYPDRPAINVTRDASLSVVALSNGPAAIAVIDGVVVCQRPGEAELHATFNGMESQQNLRFKVVENIDLASLTLLISPSPVRMAVGEQVTVRVSGKLGMVDVGDLTSLGELSWSSDQPEIVKGDSPTLTGLSEGKAQVMVKAGDISAKVDVEVVADNDVLDPLTVTPRVLRLQVGESKRLGSDVRVLRGAADFTDQAEATTPSPDIVRVHSGSRSLEGVSPGRVVVLLTVGGKVVSLPVEVEIGTEIAGGKIVIEPATASLAVGEALNVRVFLVSPEGRRIDRTGSATLSSGNSQVLSAVGPKITGIAAGEATVSAKLPGISEVAQGAYQVIDEQFTSLLVTPPRMRLAVGERRPLQIEAVGPAGRRHLSAHPNLRMIVGGSNAGAVSLEGNGTIRGVAPGKASLQVSWQGLTAPTVLVDVRNEPIKALRIDPNTALVGVGGVQTYRVFARRGTFEHLVTADDGVQLRVGSSRIAALSRLDSVQGLKRGNTVVTAKLGAKRAKARLIVSDAISGNNFTANAVAGTPTSGVNNGSCSGKCARPRPGNSGAASSSDTAADFPPSLRFMPDVMQLQLGVPNPPVRLMKVSPNGNLEDVTNQASFDLVSPNATDIVEIKHTPLGPAFVGKKPGTVEVRASAGDLVTRGPLQINVVGHSGPVPGAEPVKLVVSPDPLHISLGRTERFIRVQLVPPGGLAQDVEYSLESKDPAVVSVDRLNLQGLSAGQAIVTVRPIGLPDAYAGLKSDVSVFVETPAPATTEGRRLVLSGPTRGTVGGPLQFHVEMGDSGGSSDVSQAGASLVLEANRSSQADLRSGCVLVPNNAGSISVRARFKELVSNPIIVIVDPILGGFEQLEIDIDLRPLFVDERRSYRLWGVPIGGGVPQDLTHLIGSTGKVSPVVQVRPIKIADEGPGSVVGKTPGTFHMKATLGELESKIVSREVSDSAPTAFTLTADPANITIYVGERTTPLQALATALGDRESRPVSAQWTSESEDIVASVSGEPAQFVGKSVGRTRLTATFKDQSATVDITVVGNAFEGVVTRDDFELLPGTNRFVIKAAVTASTTADAPLEYRITTVGGGEAGEWKVSPIGAHQQFDLLSPPIRQGELGTKYHLTIEARNKQQQIIARYPLSFTLGIKP